MFWQRSLTFRILLCQSAIIVLGVTALIAVTTALYGDTLHRTESQAKASESSLLAGQMASAVKWKKPASVEKIYAPFTKEESGSNLSTLIVATIDGTVLSEYWSSHLPVPELGDIVGTASQQLSENSVIDLSTTEHVIFAVRIDDPKSGAAIGVGIFAWSELELNGLISEIEKISIGTGAIVALICVLVTFIMIRFQASRPLTAIRGAMQQLAGGDTSVDIPYDKRRDEIGSMAETVRVFRDNADQMEKLSLEREEAKRRAEEERESARQREATELAERTARETARQEEGMRRELEETEREREREKAASADRAKAREVAEQEKRAIMKRLRDGFGELVGAATQGDFSKQIDGDFGDEVLNKLAEDLNTMAGTVAAGLGETREVLGAVARFDLSRRVNGTFAGDFAELSRDVNKTADNLSQIMGQLGIAARHLHERTDALSSGFNDLSQRTANQAASVEETSAAVTMLNESVDQAAKRASQAEIQVKAAKSAAEQSNEIMESATGAMERVAKSSDEISEIVEMIEGIAFQTNLLSLNASVEAARAGDAGAGFAVVAAEVRNLAQSAAESSGKIRTLIDRSRTEVSEGVDSVGEAAKTLTTIIQSVTEVSELMDDISQQANDQAGRLSEISSTVQEFDGVTQSNAQLVETATGILSDAVVGVQQIDKIAKTFVIEDNRRSAPAMPNAA